MTVTMAIDANGSRFPLCNVRDIEAVTMWASDWPTDPDGDELLYAVRITFVDGRRPTLCGPFPTHADAVRAADGLAIRVTS